MNKPKLELVDVTFDLTFETMRDNDLYGDREAGIFASEIEIFMLGLESVIELSDEDIEIIEFLADEDVQIAA